MNIIRMSKSFVRSIATLRTFGRKTTTPPPEEDEGGLYDKNNLQIFDSKGLLLVPSE